MKKKYILSINMISLMFLDVIPSSINFGVTLFLTTLILFIFSLNTENLKIDKKILIVVSLVVIWFLLIISYSIFLKEVAFPDVFRASIPFMAIFFAIPLYMSSKEVINFPKFIMKNIIILTSVASLYNVFLFIGVYLEGLGGLKRITLLDPITTTPFSLFGSALLTGLIVFGASQRYLILILLINISGFIVTMTRSMLLVYVLILIIIIVTKFVRSKSFKFLFNLILALGTLILMTAISYNLSNPVRQIINSLFTRFSTLGENDRNVNARLIENDAALQVLNNNPILGGGLGIRFSQGNIIGEYVNYIHNGTYFSLANVGILNTSLIYLILIFATYKLIKNKNMIINSFGFGLLALTLYSQFFASFKLIHNNYLVAICISIVLYVLTKNNNKFMDRSVK